MIRRSAALARAAIVILLQGIAVTAGVCATPAERAFETEAKRQVDIYQSRGEDVPRGYVVDRSLLSYAMTFPADFRRALVDLKPGDRWLDIGAGEGNAVLDYITSKYDVMLEDHDGKARVVAMSIEDRRTRRWHETVAQMRQGELEYLHGRRLREYSNDELGKFRLITDVIGAFSYTRYLSTYMQKALGLLDVQGALYAVLQDVRSEGGTNRPYYPDARYLTEIAAPDGTEVRMCTWLKRIKCVEVTCEFRPDWTPPVEVYRVHKVCDAVTVPPLTLVHFEAGTPPERGYVLVNSDKD